MPDNKHSVGDVLYKLCEVIEKGGAGVDAALRGVVGIIPKIVEEPLVKSAIAAKVARRRARGAAARFAALGWFIGAGIAAVISAGAGLLTTHSWAWQTVGQNGRAMVHAVPIFAMIATLVAAVVMIGTLLAGVADYSRAIPDLAAPEGPVVNEIIFEIRQLVARK